MGDELDQVEALLKDVKKIQADVNWTIIETRRINAETCKTLDDAIQHLTDAGKRLGFAFIMLVLATILFVSNFALN